jgi:microcystin-dependent protein
MARIVGIHSAGGQIGQIVPGSTTGTPGPATLYCDGSAVSNTAYPLLYAVMNAAGFPWGSGIGTFNLPDLRGRAPVGAGTGIGLTTRTTGQASIGEETHLLATSEMPAHTHVERGNGNTAGGTAMTNLANGDRDSASNTDSTGGGGAHNNMQPSAVCQFAIIYK